MKFLTSEIPGVVIVEPDVFRDSRGFFLETYHLEKYQAGGIRPGFVQDNHSKSSRGSLRGLHMQLEHMQGKLIRVIEGEIFDVLVDVRKGSPSFLKWFGIKLSGENLKEVYAPPGLLHGFCVLSTQAHVEYKCTDFYHAKSELTVIWNDPEIGIQWPIQTPTLSTKDAAGVRLSDVMHRFPAFKE